MKGVLTGIFVASALAVLCEMLLPDGKLKKTARFCLGVAVSLVVISPVSTMISDINEKSLDFGDFEIKSEEAFLTEKENGEEENIEEFLKKQGVEAKVKIFTYKSKILFVCVEVADKDFEYVKKVVCSVLKTDGEKVLQDGEKR